MSVYCCLFIIFLYKFVNCFSQMRQLLFNMCKGLCMFKFCDLIDKINLFYLFFVLLHQKKMALYSDALTQELKQKMFL
jgi:hypothetical protein